MDKPVKILVLATNPQETDPLRLDEEVRGIDEALQQSRFRDKFELEQQWAVRVSDLQRFLLRYKPDIVHFSGHGSESSEIILVLGTVMGVLNGKFSPEALGGVQTAGFGGGLLGFGFILYRIIKISLVGGTSR